MNRREFLNSSSAGAAGAAVASVATLALNTPAQAATSPANRQPSVPAGSAPLLYDRLTRGNAMLLLIDHQVGLYTGVRDIEVPELKHNVVGMVKAAKALQIPIVVTTTTEKMWGPLIPELAEALGGIKTIERTTVNAWDDKRVVDAVKATGRSKLIMTGISTDVCLAFPAISAVAEGYTAYGVVDASGAFTRRQGEVGVLRMQQAGVIPVCYSNVMVEILADNAAPEANAVYAGLTIPFSGLVYGLNQYFSHK